MKKSMNWLFYLLKLRICFFRYSSKRVVFLRRFLRKLFWMNPKMSDLMLGFLLFGQRRFQNHYLMYWGNLRSTGQKIESRQG